MICFNSEIKADKFTSKNELSEAESATPDFDVLRAALAQALYAEVKIPSDIQDQIIQLQSRSPLAQPTSTPPIRLFLLKISIEVQNMIYKLLLVNDDLASV